MSLELSRTDLREGMEEAPLPNITFDDFKPDVQQAIRETGQATFYEADRRHFKDIYPDGQSP